MNILTKLVRGTAVAAIGLGLAASVQAAERLTLKSAKSGTSYYVMTVQLAEMVRKASENQILPTVEESQGSVQNVREAAMRQGNFLFTTPPSLLAAARAGEGAFEGRADDSARALFVMPFITVHFVVREGSGIDSLEDLAGKTFIPGGRGTFCEQRVNSIFKNLGLDEKINLVGSELSAASAALRNRRVDGFATCASHPTPQLVELATTLPIKVLSLSEEARARIIELDPMSGPLSIAANTYEGQREAVETVGVPVGAYGTTRMSDDVAYFVTKTFWEWKDQLAGENPWWDGVQPAMIGQMGTKLHPGARRYYEERGVEVPESML